MLENLSGSRGNGSHFIGKHRSVQWLMLCGALALVAVSSSSVLAQNQDITNKYRVTLVTSKPVTDKLVLFQYLGVVSSPDKSTQTLYYSPPGIIYKPKKWMELWLGLFGIYNNIKTANNSWELRPLTGVKFLVPNKKKITLFNFTRFEYRFINQNHNTASQPRLRNRTGIEIPLSKEKPWTVKTFYTLADVEPIWRLDDKYLSLIRVRGGLGYIVSKKWRVELIYHAEFTGNKGQPKQFTGNIWRLNIKLTLPRKNQPAPESVPDIDD